MKRSPLGRLYKHQGSTQQANAALLRHSEDHMLMALVRQLQGIDRWKTLADRAQVEGFAGSVNRSGPGAGGSATKAKVQSVAASQMLSQQGQTSFSAAIDWEGGGGMPEPWWKEWTAYSAYFSWPGGSAVGGPTGRWGIPRDQANVLVEEYGGWLQEAISSDLGEVLKPPPEGEQLGEYKAVCGPHLLRKLPVLWSLLAEVSFEPQGIPMT